MIRIACIAIAGLLAASAAHGQAETAPAEPPAAVVQGTVWDSIRGVPLAGARVFLAGAGDTVTADAHGAYRLRHDMEGRYGVAFSHPRLDSLGYSPEPVDAELSREAPATADLAIPPLASLRRAVCEGVDSAGTGVIVGRVVHRGGAPAAGQEVRFTWQRFETHFAQGNMAVGTRGVSVHADEEGRFHICGVPLHYRIDVGYPDGDRVVEVGQARALDAAPVRYDILLP